METVFIGIHNNQGSQVNSYERGSDVKELKTPKASAIDHHYKWGGTLRKILIEFIKIGRCKGILKIYINCPKVILVGFLRLFLM